MIKVAYADIYQHSLPAGHRFPMAKYELIPRQLIREGILREEQFFSPGIAGETDILRAHEEAYWFKLKNLLLDEREQRKIGFPQSPELLMRERIIVQGAITGSLHALEYGAAMNVAGGTHHAFSNRGEGFCLLNDHAIAALYLLQHHHCEKIIIVDLDVHQGNGTAQIFQNDPRVFTFSMHGHDNYPLHKEQSDMDIAVPSGCSGAEYLGILERELPALLNRERPGFIYYNAGVDVLETDKYGKLKLSMQDCKRRDELVFSIARELGIPVLCSMGGGYSPRIADIVNAHCNTFKTAVEIFG